MENTAKTSSCLAITEKKTHKPGSCVGIFFQLFDWNRRFAKKKLFSKKFLPPVDRAKQGCKKFKSDEKMPSSKLHLIADENSGGFPNTRKDSTRRANLAKQHEMRSPSLVARLMGLESMPVVNRDKPKKASFSEVYEKGSAREERNLEKRNVKIESRPPKLQKIDNSEQKPVTQFGTEALPFKSVLSRSRKNSHPPKLPSAIKSPRFSSGRRTSRLIDAATRILEPGLQATSRAKCGIMYYNSETHALRDAAMTEKIESFMGNISHENYDKFLGVEEFRQNMEECPSVYHSLASNSVNFFSQEPARSETIPPLSSLKQERDLIFERRREGTIFVDIERVPLDRQYHSSSACSQPCKLRKHDSSSFPFKHGNQSQNQISRGRDQISARSKIRNVQSLKVSSSANVPSGAMSGGNRARVGIKLENSKFDLEKRTMNGREGHLPQLRTCVRKRRTTSASGSIDSQCVANLTNMKQRNLACDKLTGRRSEFDPYSMNYSCSKTKLSNREEATNRDVVSAAMEDEIVEKRGITFQKQYAGLGGDAIGALLEQKLKELSSQEDDELTTGVLAKRSTAIILQELIAALTADPPRSHDNSVAKMNTAFNAVAVETELSTRMSKDENHFSPGSVLEASFSSSSMDDGSGPRLQTDITDYITDPLQIPESNLCDSATSLNKMESQMLNISLILQTINQSGVRLTGNKAKEVILNIELLFGNVTQYFVDESINGLLTRPLLLDELENIPDMEVRKDIRNKQRRFLFDCLIEFMDLKYSHLCNLGFNAWTRLPSCLNGRMVIRDVEDEIKKWTSFSQMCLDEMVELEMSKSLRKWTDFNVEGFETGAELEWAILENLVGEIVIDFLIDPSKTC